MDESVSGGGVQPSLVVRRRTSPLGCVSRAPPAGHPLLVQRLGSGVGGGGKSRSVHFGPVVSGGGPPLHQPQGVAGDSPGVASLRSFVEGSHRGGLHGQHHGSGVSVSPRGDVVACPQPRGSASASLGRLPPDSPCPTVHHGVAERCGRFPQSPGPDHWVRKDVDLGCGVGSVASLADDDRPLRHGTQLSPAGLLFAAQRPYGGGDRCLSPVVRPSPGVCLTPVLSDSLGPFEALVQPGHSSDAHCSSLDSGVVSEPSTSVGGSPCRPALTSQSAQAAPCPSSALEPPCATASCVENVEHFERHLGLLAGLPVSSHCVVVLPCVSCTSTVGRCTIAGVHNGAILSLRRPSRRSLTS